MTTIILGIFEEGLVYAIMALGVYITYRILDFPDLSVDGTFPLGAAFTATGIAGGFIHPAAALPSPFSWDHGGLRHRTYPCQVKGTGPAVGNHCHDRPLLHQLKGCRKVQPAYLQQGHDFQQPWLERTIPQALRPIQ